MQIEEAVSDVGNHVHGNVNYSFRLGVPTQIHAVCDTVPSDRSHRADMGIYFQDQWPFDA